MIKYPSFVDHCLNLERSENLLCFICPKFTTKDNKNETWETHFTDPLHSLVLEKFKKSFYQSSRRYINCKICLELVKVADFIEHAIEHELVPWYKSPDVFEIFFINFIAEIDGQYHCHLCKEQFSFWYSALLHVDNQKHQQNHRNKIDYDIVNETNTYTVNHQLLISHSIFRKNLQMFECMICKQCVCGYQNIDEHIKDRSHLENKATFIKKLLKKLEKVVNNENFSKNQALSTNNLKTNEENTSSNIFPYASEVDLKLENEKNLPPDLDTKLCVLIFNFCTTCAALSFGFQCGFSHNSKYPKHKCFAKLPKEARKLLIMPEFICDKKLAEIKRKVGVEKYKEERFMKDLEKIASEKFPNAMIHPYGSRVSGLGSKNSDLDVSIDCSDEVYGQDSLSRLLITRFLNEIEKSLRNYPEIWEIKRSVREGARVPIIKANHKPTGIDCDISFSNRLAVENTKLIKSYIETYPFCRKLIIFMKIWIEKCNLHRYEKLTSYAVAWMVIFYLQCEKNLQSVNELIASKNQSRLIGVGEVGVIERIKDRSSNQNFMQLLKGLFIFYSKFNYKEEVICPLLGKTIKKKRFESLKLPSAMNPYIRYLKTNNFGEFHVSSTMCLQDPSDLSDNLTKSVSEFAVHRLKSFCLLSAQILEDNF